MFAIELIHRTGSSKVATGKTLAACRERALEISECFPTNYIAATIPYAVYPCGQSPLPTVLDVSIPFEIMKSLSMELRLTYHDEITYMGTR